MYFIYFGIACSSLIQVVNCHDFSHCSSTTPLMQSQLVNETRTGSPAESESYGILSENYGNLSPAEHPSKRDIFVGSQSLVTNPTTMKSLTEFLNKNSSLLVKLICECVKRTLKHFWTDYLKHLDTYGINISIILWRSRYLIIPLTISVTHCNSVQPRGPLKWGTAGLGFSS